MKKSLSPLELAQARKLLAKLEADALLALCQIKMLRESSARRQTWVLLYRMRRNLLAS